MTKDPDALDARLQSERNKVARKAAIQDVTARNEAAHREARKKRQVIDRLKAEMRTKGNW